MFSMIYMVAREYPMVQKKVRLGIHLDDAFIEINAERSYFFHYSCVYFHQILILTN